jgi:hypothetical protein
MSLIEPATNVPVTTQTLVTEVWATIHQQRVLLGGLTMAITMHTPWPIYVLIIFVVAAAIFVRNTLKLRKQFGSHTDVEEIRGRYPRAKVFTLWPSRRNKSH